MVKSLDPGAPLKVLLVGNAALPRQVVAQALAPERGIETAIVDPAQALDKLRRQRPDVVVLDLDTSSPDGLALIRLLVAEQAAPVVACSSQVDTGSEKSMQALAAGAVNIIGKTQLRLACHSPEVAHTVARAVRAAACIEPRPGVRRETPARSATASSMLPVEERAKNTADVILAAGHGETTMRTTDKVIAIGTSTGGTQALEAVLTRLPPTVPGIVVVQHMPERFTAMFAERLNGLCQIEVREARNNDAVLPGRALIAPGGQHMLLKRNGMHYHVEVVDGPVVNRHKPSVDVLFRSVARFAGVNALGIIMTGMGDDGARGLKEMHEAGAATIAQDEASCVVFGMPKEAIRLGGVDRVLPLDQFPAAILAAYPS